MHLNASTGNLDHCEMSLRGTIQLRHILNLGEPVFEECLGVLAHLVIAIFWAAFVALETTNSAVRVIAHWLEDETRNRRSVCHADQGANKCVAILQRVFASGRYDIGRELDCYSVLRERIRGLRFGC